MTNRTDTFQGETDLRHVRVNWTDTYMSGQNSLDNGQGKTALIMARANTDTGQGNILDNGQGYLAML